MTKGVFEGKFEIDSLASFLALSWKFSDAAGASYDLTSDSDWVSAVTSIVQVVEMGMESFNASDSDTSYRFARTTYEGQDTLRMQVKTNEKKCEFRF